MPDNLTFEMNEKKLTFRLNIESIHKKCKSHERLLFIESVLGVHKQLSATELKLDNPDVHKYY